MLEVVENIHTEYVLFMYYYWGKNEEQVCYLKDEYCFWLNQGQTPTHLEQTLVRKAKFFSPLLLSTKEKTSSVQMHE
ncbi:hypothetical protein [Rossellomorea sp. YZS02]|uniref:hypothetical protein n=1 Tax=Rossellomorea sp. YZS02 TaxID=3097358 RepID=UPI002A140D5E|nr:hypothetical protein [Rossellomorea sp. YZS02]MDX8345802.1 hypothetical protein [Rossellomorea sp. YZS02]